MQCTINFKKLIIKQINFKKNQKSPCTQNYGFNGIIPIRKTQGQLFSVRSSVTVCLLETAYFGLTVCHKFSTSFKSHWCALNPSAFLSRDSSLLANMLNQVLSHTDYSCLPTKHAKFCNLS